MEIDDGKDSVLAGSGLRLGLIADFPELTAPEVENLAYDDAIAVCVHGGVGVIAGVNPRSVLRRIGLNGFISCRVHRAFLPTGLALTAMAHTLWNGWISFETIAGDYFDGPSARTASSRWHTSGRSTRPFKPSFLAGTAISLMHGRR